MTRPMKMMRESFALLGRNLVLFYPVLAFLIVTDLVRPRVVTMPGLELRWILIVAVMLLLKAAFAAGWFNMVYQATFQHWVDERKKSNGAGTPPDQESLPALSETFGLFKHFLPGVGDYFISFTFGLLITSGAFFLMFYLVQQNIESTSGYPVELMQQLEEIMTGGPEAQQDLKAFFNGLTPEQEESLSQLMSHYLWGFFGAFMFVLLTIFWAPIMMVRRVGVVRSYFQSLLLFFRDPFRLTGMGLLYGFSLFFMMTLSSMNPFISLIFLILIMFVGISVVIFLFLYVLDMFGDELGVGEDGSVAISPSDAVVDVEKEEDA